MSTIVKAPELTRAKEAGLGAIVRLAGQESFADAVVTNIVDGRVHLFRPYATTGDFSYTGGVIPYIGVEQFTVEADTPITIVRPGPAIR